MPRNVRNFWLELSVDGKRTDIATGPVSKDGGFFLTIKQRSSGAIVRAMDVRGFLDDGMLVLEATARPGAIGETDRTVTFETTR